MTSSCEHHDIYQAVHALHQRILLALELCPVEAEQYILITFTTIQHLLASLSTRAHNKPEFIAFMEEFLTPGRVRWLFSALIALSASSIVPYLMKQHPTQTCNAISKLRLPQDRLKKQWTSRDKTNHSEWENHLHTSSAHSQRFHVLNCTEGHKAYLTGALSDV